MLPHMFASQFYDQRSDMTRRLPGTSILLLIFLLLLLCSDSSALSPLVLFAIYKSCVLVWSFPNTYVLDWHWVTACDTRALSPGHTIHPSETTALILYRHDVFFFVFWLFAIRLPFRHINETGGTIKMISTRGSRQPCMNKEHFVSYRICHKLAPRSNAVDRQEYAVDDCNRCSYFSRCFRFFRTSLEI